MLSRDSYRIFLLGGGGGGGGGDKEQFIYIIWSSHDRETVKQISDENLTNWRRFRENGGLRLLHPERTT